MCDSRYLSAYLDSIFSDGKVYDVAVVWSAGRSGFLTDKRETDAEMQSYETVLSLLRTSMSNFPDNRYFFHLISSAGGLFEGQRNIGAKSMPSPVRPYGELKHGQEKRLIDCNEKIIKFIYRPTSVYGYIGGNQRMGLITTLINNGINNQISTIYGSLITLRDYVLNDDVGAYVAKRIFSTSEGSRNICYLGSGRPCSIYEVIHIVEQELGRKIYVQFIAMSQFSNNLDIVLSPSMLPDTWKPDDIKAGVRFVKECILSEQRSKFLAGEAGLQI